MKFKTGKRHLIGSGKRNERPSKRHLIGSGKRHERPMTKRGNDLTSETKGAHPTSPPWIKVVLRPFHF